MISKELFISTLKNIQTFDKEITKVGELLNGGDVFPIYNSQLFMSVDNIIQNFLETNFTEKGIDEINWWLYEAGDKKFAKIHYSDFFGEYDKVFDVNLPEKFWNYLITFKEDFIIG